MKFLKSLWFYVALVVIIGIFYFAIPGGESEPSELDGFASCLTEKGVTMYGTEWCSHCKNQKKEFGSSFEEINFVDCDANREECLMAGVEGYPTWKINGQNYPGKQPFELLGSLSGCELALRAE